MPRLRQVRDYQDETLALIAFEVGVLYAQGKLDLESLSSYLMQQAFAWAFEFECKAAEGTIDISDYLSAVRDFTHEKAKQFLGYDEDAVGYDSTERMVANGS